MTALTKAIYDLLAGDTTLCDRLKTYQGSPAIFIDDQVPEDAAEPWIFIPPAISDGRSDTKTYNGRLITLDVGVWANRSLGSKELEDIAERARGLLHHAALTITGYSNIECLADGVIGAPGDGELIGRVVMVSVLMDAA